MAGGRFAVALNESRGGAAAAAHADSEAFASSSLSNRWLRPPRPCRNLEENLRVIACALLSRQFDSILAAPTARGVTDSPSGWLIEGRQHRLLEPARPYLCPSLMIVRFCDPDLRDAGMLSVSRGLGQTWLKPVSEIFGPRLSLGRTFESSERGALHSTQNTSKGRSRHIVFAVVKEKNNGRDKKHKKQTLGPDPADSSSFSYHRKQNAKKEGRKRPKVGSENSQKRMWCVRSRCGRLAVRLRVRSFPLE